MDVRTWTALSHLLDEALDLPADDRSAWLAALPPEYESVKPRLEAMLERLDSLPESAFLAELPPFDLPDEGEPEPTATAGARFGAFRLVREIATGGQATVWLAERLDGLVNRPVAIKLPRGLDVRPDLADRMARERDILASLTHPNIARLYDAGVTADGVPFMALEYVDGVPIDRYCREHGLDVHARIRLFLQVIRAVAHAHGRLIIHRDLKPTNVLVTATGEARLLDFGIGRILDRGDPADSLVTQLGGRAMTLPYASPEQVQHQPLGVATDIYSLGVMLYELLAGAGPYVLSRDSAAQLEEAIVNQEPRPASAAAVESADRKALRGDLDTILAKALKKAPSDRYASADALADDLAHALEGRPVMAQPDTRRYRARKFVARHRTAVAAAALVVLAIVGGAFAAGWQARVARAEQQRAEQVKGFVVSLLQDANLDEIDSRPASVADLLRRATARVGSLPADAVKAELLVVVGEGLLGLGDTDALETVAGRAVAEADRLGDESLGYRARVLMASAHMYRGRPDKMSKTLDEIAPGLARDPRRFARELSIVWRLRADAAIDAGRYEEAVAAARLALEHITPVAAAEPAQELYALTTLAEAYDQAGQADAALRASERALSAADRLHGANHAHPAVLSARARYGSALGQAGDLAAAVDQLQRVVDDGGQVFGEDGRTVAFHLQRLANFQIRLGRLDAGVASVTRGLRIMEQHAEPGSPTLAAFHGTAGHAQLAARRPELALPHLTDALETASRAFGPGHANTLTTRASRALALCLAGRTSEARREIGETVAAMREAGAPLARPLYAAGAIERRTGAADTAVALLEEAEVSVGDDASLEWQIVTERGLAAIDAGQSAEALSLLDRARGLVRQLGIEDQPGTADLAGGRGRALIALGRSLEGLPELEAAARFWARFDPEHPAGRDAASAYARALSAAGRGGTR